MIAAVVVHIELSGALLMLDQIRPMTDELFTAEAAFLSMQDGTAVHSRVKASQAIAVTIP